MTQTAARWQAEYSPDVGWVVTDRPAPGESYDNAFFCQFEANAVSLAVMLNHYEQAKAALEEADAIAREVCDARERVKLRDRGISAGDYAASLLGKWRTDHEDALSSPPATQEKQG
jgi:hypothetical protein